MENEKKNLNETEVSTEETVTHEQTLKLMSPMQMVIRRFFRSKLSIVGLVMVGLGCAPVYPCIIHSTPDHFGAENSQGIIGIQMASAYVGSTFMPPVFGLIANHISLKLMPAAGENPA